MAATVHSKNSKERKNNSKFICRYVCGTLILMRTVFDLTTHLHTVYGKGDVGAGKLLVLFLAYKIMLGKGVLLQPLNNLF
jgi:hypothetical protein